MRVTKKELKRIIIEALEESERRKIFVLVGPPSVGKSTWVTNTLGDDVYSINRDDIVESVASELGWTYDDMFVSPPDDSEVGESDTKYGNVVESPQWMTWQPTVFDKVLAANGKVQQLFQQRVSGAVPSGLNIVIDMTNMNADSRSRALQAIEGSEGDFDKIAVDFKFQGSESIITKVAERRSEAGKRMGKSKTIPTAAFQRMFSTYESPTEDEGFDLVIDVDNREFLRSLV